VVLPFASTRRAFHFRRAEAVAGLHFSKHHHFTSSIHFVPREIVTLPAILNPREDSSVNQEARSTSLSSTMSPAYEDVTISTDHTCSILTRRFQTNRGRYNGKCANHRMKFFDRLASLLFLLPCSIHFRM
jgi:hypothetical protein